MKKIAAIFLFIALATPVFADESTSGGGSFVKNESDRSGLTGTFTMIGNSIGGFFSQLGSRLNPSKSK
jgi:hypothetical protein